LLRVRSSRGALLALVLTLVTAWAALLFGALPSPAALNFPLNDDWVYSRTFFHFLRGEPLRFYNWPSMPQIGMWWMPWLMAQLFGATHAALRYGTVLFSLAGAAAVYDLLRQGGVSPRRAAFAAATFGLTPLYFLCSATFMTDVPSLALALCSMALLLRGVRGQGAGQGIGYLIAGAVIATMAAMTRQNTLAVPVVML